MPYSLEPGSNPFDDEVWQNLYPAPGGGRNIGGINNLIADATQQVQDLVDNPGFEGDEVDAIPEYLVNEYRGLRDRYNAAHQDDSPIGPEDFENISNTLYNIEQNFPLIGERLTRDERLRVLSSRSLRNTSPSVRNIRRPSITPESEINLEEQLARNIRRPSVVPESQINLEEQNEPFNTSGLDVETNKKRFSPKSLLKNTVSRITESAPVQNAKDFSKTFAENLRTSLNLDAPVYSRAQFPVGSNPNLSKLMLLQREGGEEYSPTMGTTVNYDPSWRGEQSLSFKGPAGYEDVRSLKKIAIPNLRQSLVQDEQELYARNKIAELKAEGIDVDISDVINPEDYKVSRMAYIKDPRGDAQIRRDIENQKRQLGKLISSVNKMENPFYPDFLKYQLGSRIESTPVGAKITQQPIGGPAVVNKQGRVTGGRDALYTRMSNRALVADPHGSASAERLGPDQWRNIYGEEVTWNPSALKDPALRTALGVPKGADVSGYRAPEFQPQPLFKDYNPSKTPIFKDSPQFKMPRATLAASVSALPDVIPSAEVIKATAKGGPLAGIGEYAKEQVMSVPTSAAVGLGTYLVPGALPFVPGVAAGVALTEAGRSLQEASRQLTGESALSKIRQTIGTKPRTGFATSTPQETYQRAQQRVDNPPQIKPLTRPVPKSNQINRQSSPMDEFKRRARMAGARFNPLKGEFGLTEMLFGR